MNLTLHLTDNCNMDCSYCIREKCPKDMTEEVLYKACDLAFSKGQRAGLCFFGGEPLLKKDLIYKALDYCEAKSKETGMRFDCKMTTNGTLLDEEFILRAKKAKMGIGLSFDGKAQDVCRFFVGGKPTSAVVEEKAKLLLKLMPESTALATIAPQAVPYYFESVKYLHDLGFRKVSFVLAYGNKVNWTEEDLKLLRVELEKTADYIKELFIKKERFFMSALIVKITDCIKGANSAERCHLGVRQMPVTPDGDLYPCTSFIGDEPYKLGTVFEGVNDAKIIELSKRSSTPETCVNCDLVKRCTNSCGCANRMNTGDENKVSPLQCTYERMLIEIADALGEELYQIDPVRFMEYYSK